MCRILRAQEINKRWRWGVLMNSQMEKNRCMVSGIGIPVLLKLECTTPCHVAFSDLCSSLTQLWLCGGDLGWKKVREERGLGKQSMGHCVGLIPLKWCLQESGKSGYSVGDITRAQHSRASGWIPLQCYNLYQPDMEYAISFCMPMSQKPGCSFYFPLMDYGILM